MELETGYFASPPPPPPPSEAISIQNILDNYYESGSFASDSEASDALNAADLMLAEMDKISPPKAQIDGAAAVKGVGTNGSLESIRSRLEEIVISEDEITSNEVLPLSEPKNVVQSQGDQLIASAAPTSILQTESQTGRQNNSEGGRLNDDLTNESNLHQRPDREFSKTTSSLPRDEKDLSVKGQQNECVSSPTIPNGNKGNATKKKPFLRKGTRKEPSAIHRFNTAKKDNVLQTSNSTKSTEQKELENLERMQEQQRENLQKRIERRQRAREEIRKGKTNGCKMQVVDQTSETNDEKIAQHGVSYQEGKKADDRYEVESSSSDSDTSSFEESYGSDNFEEEEETPSRKMQSKCRPKPRSGKIRSPLKVINKSRCNQKQKTKDFQSPELEEQWQVIKSMRRRQESALRAAEKEREEVSFM